jgi:N-methylhydantoinase B
MTGVDPVSLEVFKNLFISVAEEMGVTLGRTAYSPNIKERRDYSCACFQADGRMLAQAAHIPVHLGAMPAAVCAALNAFGQWAPGDLVILNDPYLGGTHLPDITMVSPVFVEGQEQACFFVSSRAHHADVGGMSPGSMPLAREIYQEGLIIPPVKLIQAGERNQAVLDIFLRNVRTPAERRGDLAAQMAAQRTGERRMQTIVQRYGLAETLFYAHSLLSYAERLTRAAIAQIPEGVYRFRDEMDDEGLPAAWNDLPGQSRAEHPTGDGGSPQIQVTVTVARGSMTIDFTGSSPAVAGTLNAVRAITESATWYVVRCLAGPDVPVNSGAFAPVRVIVPKNSILAADPPHAVAGGNVETSQRVVDVVLGALAKALPDTIPAASQGTMNNLAVGGWDAERNTPYAYYETIGGGAGAGPQGVGLSGVHVHMTNTLNTPIEALEYGYPCRVLRYALRKGSGGAGQHAGGDGLKREIEFLDKATITLLSERRRTRPYGLHGGQPGTPGRNVLIREGREIELPGKAQVVVEPGDILSLETPGGGGWGHPTPEPFIADP